MAGFERVDVFAGAALDVAEVARIVVVFVACTAGRGAPTVDLGAAVLVVVVFLTVVVAVPLVIGFLAAAVTDVVVFFSIGAFTVRTAGLGAAVVAFDARVFDGDEADVRAVVAAGFSVDFNGAAAGFLAANVAGFFVAAVTFGSLACVGDLAEATAAAAIAVGVATPAAAAKRSTLGSSGWGTSAGVIGTSTVSTFGSIVAAGSTTGDTGCSASTGDWVTSTWS